MAICAGAIDKAWSKKCVLPSAPTLPSPVLATLAKGGDAENVSWVESVVVQCSSMVVVVAVVVVCVYGMVWYGMAWCGPRCPCPALKSESSSFF